MCPISYIEPETLKKKVGAFHNRRATTHWPQYALIPVEEYGQPKRKVNGVEVEDPHNRQRPVEEPVLGERELQLAGVKPY